MQKSAEPKESVGVKRPKSNKLTFKEKKEFESLEIEIDQLENEKKYLTEKLNAGEGSPDDFANWSRRYQEVDAALDEKSMRWLELSEKEQ